MNYARYVSSLLTACFFSRVYALALLLALSIAFVGCDRGVEGTAASSEPAKNPEPYAFGTTVKAGKGGEFGRYAVSGWSKTEDQFTWTEGNTAVLAMHIPATEAGITLKMRANGLIHPPALPHQPVEVLVNNQKIADWTVGGVAEHSSAIPPQMVNAGGLLTITFKMPKAVAPKAVAGVNDQRVLGLCVHDFELREVF